jgi:glycosyltransferase involved in cell wall biosynthesis
MQKTNFEYEIIIHDDASSDETPEIIKEYASKYPEKIIPVIQIENQFSKGIEIIDQFVIPKARGKYIAFLEGDDYWIGENKLQTQIDFMESNPEIAMCFTATKHIFPNSSKKPNIKKYKNHDSICEIKDVIRWGGSLVDMGSAVVRRSIFTDVPDWYYQAQTWDLTVPLLSLLHGKIQYLNQVTAIYRYLVSGSWTQKNIREYERRKKNRMKVIRVTDGFDQETNFKYHKYVRGRLTPLIVEVLLLSDKNDPEFNELYSRLSPFSKLEYHFFNLFKSLRLWEIYRYYRRLVTGY